MGIAILNKISGFYGILSLITGHPIDFSQWVFYLSSILILPFYINGLQNVKNPNLPKFSLISLIFCGDTLASILFILFFSYQWFSTDSSGTVVKDPVGVAPPADAVSQVTKSTTGVIPEAKATANAGAADTVVEQVDAKSTAATTTTSDIITKQTTTRGLQDDYVIETPGNNDAAADAADAGQIDNFELESPDEDKNRKIYANRLVKKAITYAASQVTSTSIASAATAAATQFLARDAASDKEAAKLASQSASKTYELMTTILTCVIVIIIRIYFTLVILSFTRLLLKSSKYGVDSDDFNNRRSNSRANDVNESKFKQYLHKMEDKAVDFIIWVFDE